MRLQVRDATDRAACVELLRRVETFAIDGASAEQMAAGCALLELNEDGRRVGAVAIELHGERATITAASSHGLATWAELQMIEKLMQSHGVKRLGLFTQRRGLVRQLKRRGYRVVRPWGTGFALEMEKDI